MDAEMKAKWVAALRSGEYKQGFGSLQCADGYCCLGVLAVIAGLKIEGNHVVDDSGADLGYRPICELLADEPVADLTAFWWRNDGRQGYEKHTFPEIADYIEANL